MLIISGSKILTNPSPWWTRVVLNSQSRNNWFQKLIFLFLVDFFLSLACIYYLFYIFNFLLWGTFTYCGPTVFKNPIQWNVSKEKILKLHKYPFLVNIWGKQFKEKALHHVKGKKIIMISIQDPHSALRIREHLLAVLEDLWVEIACYLKDRIKLNFGAQQLYMISCLCSKMHWNVLVLKHTCKDSCGNCLLYFPCVIYLEHKVSF